MRKEPCHVQVCKPSDPFRRGAQDPFLVAYVNLKLAACGATPVKMTPKVILHCLLPRGVLKKVTVAHVGGGR